MSLQVVKTSILNEESRRKDKGVMSQSESNVAQHTSNNEKVNGVHLEKCIDCLVRKQNRASFHSRPPRRREVALELLHTGVCYVDARSHRVRQYFVTFIEDYPKPSEVVGFRSKVKGPSTVTL